MIRIGMCPITGVVLKTDVLGTSYGKAGREQGWHHHDRP
jgi:hypothetical protein